MTSQHNHRLAALRAQLDPIGLDDLIIATGDEHITEFPAPYSRRRSKA